MFKPEMEIPEIARVIKKYGQGFDVIYFDGKADGKLEIARNGLIMGVDEETILRMTGVSIDQLKDLKVTLNK